MKTREQIKEEILQIRNNHILLELATSVGKSKFAMEILNNTPNVDNILIVIPRLVLIDTWKAEFKKWNFENMLPKITFSTYVSLDKHVGKWDFVIFDECHHLSDRCMEILKDYKIKRTVLLSATVKFEHKRELNYLFKDLYCYKVSTREAIEGDILPDPNVILIPLYLDSRLEKEIIIKNPKATGKTITTTYHGRWAHIRNKTDKIVIYCTEEQRNADYESMINWYKKKYMSTRNEIIKGKWLHLAKERLDWLSSLKNNYLKQILAKLNNERTLVFCNNIEQTEVLGKYCINSKNDDSADNLKQFNEGKINHITSCNMLNEGVNLVDCRVGIYGNLNSSEILVTQRLGRLLRHENPVIIIPYYKDTREEQLVLNMIENYNKDKITVIYKIQNLEI